VNSQQLLHWGSPAAAVLPRFLAEALADATGGLAYRLAPAGRRVLERNLSLVQEGTAPDAAVRGAFRTYARYYLATMRLAHSGLRRAVGEVRWENAEVLAASLAAGRGVVVLTGHVGNWDVLGAGLAAEFGEVCAAVEMLRPPRLFQFYTKTRQRHGVSVAPVGDPGRRPVEVLGRNGILGVAVDRPFGSRRAEASCGGAILEVPTGAIRLGLRHGAAVHAAFAIRVPGGFALRAGPDWGPALRAMPVEVARLQAAASLFASALRDIVVRHPDQWCLLQPLLANPAAVAREAA
jgi:KDO2-lipid IV(A) lauroyltransferase